MKHRRFVPEGWRSIGASSSVFLRSCRSTGRGFSPRKGRLDAASRRNRLLERQTASLAPLAAGHPVIAAGLIGGIPAMTELLSLVAALDHGAVILPGLDRDRDDAEWSAIARTKPARSI